MVYMPDKNMDPKSAKLIQSILYFAGFTLMMAGGICFAVPSILENLLGFDGFMNQMLSGMIALVGVSDIFIARVVFGNIIAEDRR